MQFLDLNHKFSNSWAEAIAIGESRGDNPEDRHCGVCTFSGKRLTNSSTAAHSLKQIKVILKWDFCVTTHDNFTNWMTIRRMQNQTGSGSRLGWKGEGSSETRFVQVRRIRIKNKGTVKSTLNGIFLNISIQILTVLDDDEAECWLVGFRIKMLFELSYWSARWLSASA